MCQRSKDRARGEPGDGASVHVHPSTCMYMYVHPSTCMYMYVHFPVYYVDCFFAAPTSKDLEDFDDKLKQLLTMGISEVHVHACIIYMYMIIS